MPAVDRRQDLRADERRGDVAHEAHGDAVLPVPRDEVERPAALLHAVRQVAQQRRREERPRALRGRGPARLEVVGVRVLQREGDLRRDEQDHPRDVDPEEQDRHGGEGPEELAVLRHADLQLEAELEPHAEADRREEAAGERGAEPHVRVRRAAQDEAEAERQDDEHPQHAEDREAREAREADGRVERGHLLFEHREDRHGRRRDGEERQDDDDGEVVGHLAEEGARLGDAPHAVERLLDVADDADHRPHEHQQADAAERAEVELLDDVEALVDELEERVLGNHALRRRRRRLRRAVGAGGVTSDE